MAAGGWRLPAAAGCACARSSAPAERARGQDMERLIPLTVLVWCAAGEPLSAAVRRRSDDGAYAQRFARDYEPALFVALPLHRPVPVLQLLSAEPAPHPSRARPPAAASAPPVYAASAPHVWHRKPTSPPGAESQTYYSKTKPLHYKTTSTWYGNKQQSETSSWYGEPSAVDSSPVRYGQRLRTRQPSLTTAAPAPAWQEQSAPQDAGDYYEPPAEEQVNTPVVLYARPTEQGGYKYRKRPAKPPKKAEPIIIRIHKHRVIRDD